MQKSRLICFGLALAASWAVAMLLPVGRWPALALGNLIAGLILLAFAGLGMPGFPAKGTADPRDTASGGLGLLLSALIVYIFSRL